MPVVKCQACGDSYDFPDEYLGQQTSCPTCGNQLSVGYIDDHSVIDHSGPPNWYYVHEKLFGETEIGPISDESFLHLIRSKKLKPHTLVRSPTFTGNQWCNLRNLDLRQVTSAAHKRVEQVRHQAEKRKRAQHINQENLRRLRAYIKDCVADGLLQSGEESNIRAFAEQAKINLDSVRAMIREEATTLIADLIDAAMEDGELSPDEEAHLTKTANHFGIPDALEGDNQTWLELGRLAWLLNHCEIDEYPETDAPFPLQSREKCISSESIVWHTVKQSRSKSNPGLRLDEHGQASVYLTNKRIIFVTDFDSKAARYSSIAAVRRYRDGVLLVRNSGGNYFLQFLTRDSDVHGIGLLLERMVLPPSHKIAASKPISNFIAPSKANAVEAIVVDEYPADQIHVGSGPRFTFRVVGTHHEQRYLVAQQLSLNEGLLFMREPTNPYDHNAVAVLDGDRRMIGYLKREVAEWFAPKMDRGYEFAVYVHRIRDDGSIIAGIVET